jgi:hypothetical protein
MVGQSSRRAGTSVEAELSLSTIQLGTAKARTRWDFLCICGESTAQFRAVL